MTLSQYLEIATVVVAAMACLGTWVNRRAIHDVHVSINSRLTELLRATRAEGVAEGTARERERSPTQS